MHTVIIAVCWDSPTIHGLIAVCVFGRGVYCWLGEIPTPTRNYIQQQGISRAGEAIIWPTPIILEYKVPSQWRE